MHTTAIRLFLTALLGSPAAVVADAGLQPRAPIIKPPRTVLQWYHRDDVIQVKFLDDGPIRLRDGVPDDLGSGALDGAGAAMALLAGAAWQPLVDAPEAQLEALRATAQQRLGRGIADFRAWYRVVLPAGADAAAAIDALNRLDCVELAEPVQQAAPPPLPPPYGGLQRDLNAGPVGLGAMAAWEHLGSRGGGAVIVDLEFGYDGHQDLPAIGQIGPPGDPAPQSDRSHGTAVLGVLASKANGWGTTGLAPDASIFFAAVQHAGVVNIPQAIIDATVMTGIAGAIILIEQQIAGPVACGADPCTPLGLPPCDCSAGTAWVPVEWDLATYSAIMTAVGNGKTVIEPAGNGAQDLDAPIYSMGNNGHWPFLAANDSGAVMVGAGRGLDFVDTFGSRICCSNYGSRVDVQGHGSGVRTTGYGDLYSAEGQSLYYTNQFAGTSSASACVAGAAALVQAAYFAANSGPSGPAWMSPGALRSALVQSGSPQQPAVNYPFPASQNIGPTPDAAIAIALAVGGCVPLYGTAIGNPGMNSWVSALISHDDGGGAKLYAGGAFSSAGGGAAANVAAWDGTSWSAVGAGPGLGSVLELAVHDDGSGAKLYAGGSAGVAAWNGTSWSAVGGAFDGAVLALASFGGDLYAGGWFANIGATAAPWLARWNGSSWSAAGGGFDGTVNDLLVYNDGGGVDLYAGGWFTSPGAGGVARWDGSSWTALGAGLYSGVSCLATFHDGASLDLYAGGQFYSSNGYPNRVAKWTGSQWVALGSPSYNGLFDNVEVLLPYDDGTGRALFMGGAFEQAEDAWVNKAAKWDGTRYWPMGDGILGGVSALAVHDDGSGPALYLGGGFSAAWDLPSFNVVRYGGCTGTPCPGDLDGDGNVGVTDFLALLAAWGPNPGHPADGNGDGNVDTIDFLALLAGWGGCP